MPFPDHQGFRIFFVFTREQNAAASLPALRFIAAVGERAAGPVQRDLLALHLRRSITREFDGSEGLHEASGCLGEVQALPDLCLLLGGGCTLTVSHDFSLQNRSCSRNRQQKLSAPLLL